MGRIHYFELNLVVEEFIVFNFPKIVIYKFTGKI